MKQPAYEYKAKFIAAIDGDTVDLEVDMGFRVLVRERFRLYGINAPEMKLATAEAGKAARNALHSMLSGGDDLLIRTHKGQDKYGRWLAEIVTKGESMTVNDRMVRQGHAVEYMRD